MDNVASNQDKANSMGIPTNDSAIEELTEDFESSLLEEKKEAVQRDSKDDELKGTEEMLKEEESAKEDESEAAKQVEESEEKPFLEDDTIDEEGLKEMEGSMTDEEKEKNKAEAQRLKNDGNEAFHKGEYLESIHCYTLALRTCPHSYNKERAILYANRAAAKLSQGFKEPAIEDCTLAIERNPEYLKAILRRAKLYEETEKLDEALADYKAVLQIDPLHREALYAEKRLPQEIQERNEKLKAEMLGKLKDLGNLVLRPFGLSTENFKMSQDPNTGGYSVSFQQKPS